MLLDTATKTRKNASKKVIQKINVTSGEFSEIKIADTVTKLYDDQVVKKKTVIHENSKNIKEIIIPREKREDILNELSQVL